LVPLVGAHRDDHTRVDLKGGVEMLEFRNDVPLQVFTRLGSDVEGGNEESPVFETIAEIGDVGRLELKEKLADSPFLRPRLERNSRVGFPNPDARHKTERGQKAIANLLPCERQIPSVVWVGQSETARIVDAKSLVVGSLEKQIEDDVLVALELGSRKLG